MAYTKPSLDFYNVDTDRYQDRRIKRLKKAHECQGIAVYDFLLCEVYRVSGCYAIYDDDTVFDVAEYFDLEETEVRGIVDYCAEIGLFDRGMLDKGVITSVSIQRRYMDICVRARRKGVEIPKEYNLIGDFSDVQDAEEASKNAKESREMRNDAEELAEIATTSSENAEESTQSKVKESKVKKNKENSLSLTPSREVVSESAAEAAERDKFFEIFFFMNFQNPASEVDRFVNHYSANGWCRKGSTTPVKDRIALARTWQQEAKNVPPRFPPEFLANWQTVYAEAKARDSTAAKVMLTDLTAVEITPQVIRLYLSERLRQLIEGNLEFFRDRLLNRFYAGKRLFYVLKS